jgi:hypothetical protein
VRSSTTILALGGACAVCCALPFAASWFAGSTILAVLGLGHFWIGAALSLAPVGALLVMRKRVRAESAPSCGASEATCGCAGGTKLILPRSETPPIACTLTADGYQTRVARIRDLAARSLRAARREPLRLHLSYAPEAAAEVRELVREEQQCCAFLQFDVREDAGGIHVTITAPEEARDAADVLFAHFAPELAASTAAALSSQKEPVPS